ncbi:MAG: hypothetical protein VX589_05900 [Myxococcota bacterium]|nr:hypothetical protein [Myxococcota bacterium]
MRIFSTILLATALVGCGQLDEGGPAAPTLKSAWADMDTALGVRFDLAQLIANEPAMDYADLLASGAVTATTTWAGTDGLRSTLRHVLLATTRERTERLDDAVVRVQRFKINQDFTPLKLMGEQIETVLPFDFYLGGDVEFARMFEDEQAANAAVPFSLLDYPHNAAAALRLPIGTVVTIPIRGRVSFDVGGQFLTGASTVSRTIAQYVSASAVGTTSASRQGMIVGEGRFSLQIVRLAGERVRVRLTTAEHITAHARLTGHTLAHASYFFLPAAQLDRIRVFRRRLDQLANGVSQVRRAGEHVDALRAFLPQLVRNAFDAFFVNGTLADSARDRIVATVDPVLKAAQGIIDTAAVLDEKVGRHVDAALEATQSFWDQRIEPVSNRLRAMSSRAFNLGGTIQLKDGLSRRLNRLGDFVFDLASEEARIALDHLITGRAIWRGTQAIHSAWGQNLSGLIDFSLAHEMAAHDRGHPNPRVRVLGHAQVDRRRRDQQVMVSGLGLNAGLHARFDDNRVQITDEQGRKTRWLIRSWERGRHRQFKRTVQSESFASGAFTKDDGADLSDGGYWYRWRKTYRPNAPHPMADTIRHVVNDLGPLAMHFGVPDLYHGEFEGTVEADLLVVFSGQALEFLFDASRMTETTLWSTFGEMMSRYERPVFLPYAHAPIRPRHLDEVDGAREACEAIAHRIGGRYCYSLADRIIPALRHAQTSGTAADRLGFFESFYRVPAGGAVLSTRTLGRLLAELVYQNGLSEHVSVQLVIRNDQDDSEAASPTITVGQPTPLALGEATLLDGLIPVQ